VACGGAPHALRGNERGQHLSPHQGLKAPQPRCRTRGLLCIERGVLGGTAASAGGRSTALRCCLGGRVDTPSSFSFSLSPLLTFSISLSLSLSLSPLFSLLSCTHSPHAPC
jgi:hypothetical protein